MLLQQARRFVGEQSCVSSEREDSVRGAMTNPRWGSDQRVNRPEQQAAGLASVLACCSPHFCLQRVCDV